MNENTEIPDIPVRVSVITPCYNHGAFLNEAVESVLKSSFEDYEIIIVDDGSTDPLTIKVFEQMEERFRNNPRIRIIHQENMGLAGARNTAVREARGEYILPVDADNRIRPHYMSKGVEILDKHPEVGVVYSYCLLFGVKEQIREVPVFNPREILLGNFIDACAVIRKRLWEDCSGYDPDMGIMGYEDWDLWIGAMEKGWKFHLIKEVLFDYREQDSSMVSACNVPDNRKYLIRYICNKHKDTYIKHLDYVLAEKEMAPLHRDKIIRGMEAVMRGKDDHIKILDAMIKDRDTHIQNIEAYIKSVDGHVRNIEAALQERDARVSGLEAMLKEKEETLNQTFNSRGWKLLVFCSSSKDRMFPENSRRRRFIGSIYRIILSIKSYLSRIRRSFII